MAMSSRSASVGVSSPTSMGQLNLMFMEQMRQDLHVVKCVVVGDTGVGKTRLICSRACGTRYSLPQLSASHVPTVWAIDQYRKSQQVAHFFLSISQSICQSFGQLIGKSIGQLVGQWFSQYIGQ